MTCALAAPATAQSEERDHAWYVPAGLGLTIGGGADDFVAEGYRTTTSSGGAWNVRGTLGTRSYIAVEASYIGSAQSIDALGIASDAVLVSNGVQAALRLNVLGTYNVDPLYVQPFIFGGGAWRHYSLSNTDRNTSDVADSDDVLELPFGLGLGAYVGGVMADVRVEYRGAWGSDLIPPLEGFDEESLIGPADRWGVTGNLGVAF